MLKKLSTFLIVFTVLTAVAFAQDKPNVQSSRLNVDGTELGSGNGSSAVSQSVHFNPVVAGDLEFTFSNTTVFTGYDLEGNGTPQHIWVDPNDPNNIHMAFTTSSETATWSDRNGTYVFSDDMGSSWTNLGVIATPGRGGFVTIDGLMNGNPVTAMHTTFGGIAAARTQVFVRSGSAWTNYTPPQDTAGGGADPIWPRVLGIGNEKVVVASSENPTPWPVFQTTVLDLTAGTFSPWQSISGDQAEVYSLAKTDDEATVGLAYIGSGDDSLTFGSAYYRESADNGLSWSDPVQIFKMDYESEDSLGAIRGIDLTFLNDIPYVVIELQSQDFAAGTFISNFPNQIVLWSPAIPDDSMYVIADSTMIPYVNNYAAGNDVMGWLTRPSIGKSADNSTVFVTFSAATENVFGFGPDTTSYMAGYITYSQDGGATFTAPEKFSPDTPLRDWRYINLASVSPVSGDMATVMMAATVDSIPGSTVNAPTGFPRAVSAELVFISTQVQVPVGVDDNNQVINSYNLEQNYPNPFNPNTNIKFSLQEPSDVSLKVYDVLGNEVATLVNGAMQVGTHSVTFDASNLASGMYLYTLKAGSFTSTKKMILMK